MSWRGALATAMFAGGGLPSVAIAQGLVVQPAIPQGFDRERNVSVLSRSRPSYTPLGIRQGGLIFYPRLETGGGATSNAYLTEQNRVEAAFVSVEPSLRMTSDWSRHSLELSASGAARNYIGESRRNERTWDLGGAGEVELGRAVKISGELRASQGIENLFSGEVDTTVAALSRFRHNVASLRAEYRSGRIRTFVVGDYATFRFNPVELSSGAFRDQSGRDRTVGRVTAQFEYARTPSVSFFGQIGYVDTSFDRQPAVTRLDSASMRMLGGFNIDIAGRARGTFGVGYSVRDYRVGGFDTVRGLIAEGRIEFFPSDRLTISTGARRTTEETTQATTTPQPFWDNRLTIGADYELLRNLILSADGEIAIQTFINRDQQNIAYRVSSDARYLMSRRVTLNGSVGYSQRRSSGATTQSEPGEGRVTAGLTFHL